jgi:hypothetical protein
MIQWSSKGPIKKYYDLILLANHSDRPLCGPLCGSILIDICSISFFVQNLTQMQ